MKNSILILLFLATSCSFSPDSPEGLLKMFVRDVTTKDVDRNYYEKFTTGEMLESITDLTDEQLSEKSRMKNVKNTRVNIVNRKCSSDDKCLLTYVITYTYLTGKEDSDQYKNEVRKIAEIEKVDGNWKIASVTNLKTYMEGLNPINAAGE